VGTQYWTSVTQVFNGVIVPAPISLAQSPER
jgi:hypothetical protein